MHISQKKCDSTNCGTNQLYIKNISHVVQISLSIVYKLLGNKE